MSKRGWLGLGVLLVAPGACLGYRSGLSSAEDLEPAGRPAASPRVSEVPAAARDPRLHVLFLGGQSNAIGERGEGETMPPGVEIPFLARSLGPAGYDFDTGPVPVPLGSVGGFHSLELAAAKALYQAGWHVAVVKLARGTSWLGEWRPAAPTGYWSALLDMRQRARDAWGDEAVWHFVWLQSESDAQQANRASVYADNLRGFVDEVRGEFGPIGFWQCKLQPSQANANGVIVRAAQVEVMAEDPRNHLLDFDDLRGALHYTSPQLDEMGRRVAHALLADPE
jgi:hypothetical protein